jgi:Transposase DDE domain
LLASLVEESLLRSPSYNDLAARIETNDAADPSRQAIALRLNKSFEDLLKTLLGHVISLKVNQHIEAGKFATLNFRSYQRVLVQDSTIIKLPAALFPEFSGVSNGHSTVCNARIQAVYDLISGKIIEFSIDPYSKNDLAAAPELEIREGDLVLRDRGYLTASEIQRHIDQGADFIYRHKTGMIYLDPETHLPVDLPALLKRSGSLDLELLMNDTQRTRIRLLAAPVSMEIANLRRMKAKKESKGHNPSQAVLELMDWTIYITNIPAHKANFTEILGIYSLRWRIEVIFKAWKSHLKFHILHRVSTRQLRILLKIRLLVIAAVSNVYGKFERILWLKHQRRLSLLKFINYLAGSITRLTRVIRSLAGDPPETIAVEKVLAKYCCYDKRKKRKNFNEIWEFLA